MTKLLLAVTLTATLNTLLLAQTTLSLGERSATNIDFMQANEIRDTTHIKQDPTPFTKEIELMSADEQLEYDRIYNEKYFAPWTQSTVELSKGAKTWQFKYAKEKTYRSDGQSIPKSWYRYEITNSNFKNSDTLNIPAITLRHTDLRLYPSSRGIYYDPKRAGEGFPFDYSQNSSVHINTPIIISHYSLDQLWVYAQTSFASGWIKIDDIAFTNLDFQEKFQNDNYAITVKDNLKLSDDNGEISLVKMGSIFPIDPKTKKYLMAKKDEKGFAKLEKVTVNDVDIIAQKPIKFNEYNLAYISKQLVGEPYGWGGKERCRDCSALTRDFFSPFGIYLPRNSRQQAKSGAEFMSLKGLGATQKKQTIVDYAKPFRSMLFVPGHITLYLGEKKGEPIILHNYWGVRLNDGSKKVMGRAIISTTTPGKELPDVKQRSMLINTLTGIVNF
ncbi:MAG: lipoprotein, NLP/P60 family [uncultured Sulfurovum sp.]|uniref:Lipoprotein, NLP/P60 family n=1 Tax=uncultured Sulfurovum sp. TaxID=269237 RepID=A0A6S6TPX8_9BACT|nr:MAG: lipoprotein, NLP/P60 family [uncultured Sulfurovum sp.]